MDRLDAIKAALSYEPDTYEDELLDNGMRDVRWMAGEIDRLRRIEDAASRLTKASLSESFKIDDTRPDSDFCNALDAMETVVVANPRPEPSS